MRSKESASRRMAKSSNMYQCPKCGEVFTVYHVSPSGRIEQPCPIDATLSSPVQAKKKGLPQ